MNEDRIKETEYTELPSHFCRCLYPSDVNRYPSRYSEERSMKRVLNTDGMGKFAMQGYDPVAFHTVGKPVKADPYIAAEAFGYKFLFASEANKALFLKNPEKYLPAFGGYCAFGVSLGVFFPVEISTWEMIDGQVVFQFSQEIKDLFSEDKEGNLKKARTNWKKVEV